MRIKLDKTALLARVEMPAGDLEFLEAQRYSREDICAFFAVSPADLGLFRPSRSFANAETQYATLFSCDVDSGGKVGS